MAHRRNRRHGRSGRGEHPVPQRDQRSRGSRGASRRTRRALRSGTRQPVESCRTGLPRRRDPAIGHAPNTDQSAALHPHQAACPPPAQARQHPVVNPDFLPYALMRRAQFPIAPLDRATRIMTLLIMLFLVVVVPLLIATGEEHPAVFWTGLAAGITILVVGLGMSTGGYDIGHGTACTVNFRCRLFGSTLLQDTVH